MSTLEQNSVSPAPATQIPLPPSAQSFAYWFPP
uniref:Uncharacterized protein n=1 Tax=Moniliophthora roreri TaxID=221103 RepID=A0A0W0G4J3_MONRR